MPLSVETVEVRTHSDSTVVEVTNIRKTVEDIPQSLSLSRSSSPLSDTTADSISPEREREKERDGEKGEGKDEEKSPESRLMRLWRYVSPNRGPTPSSTTSPPTLSPPGGEREVRARIDADNDKDTERERDTRVEIEGAAEIAEVAAATRGLKKRHVKRRESRNLRFRPSLRPSSSELSQLHLQPGRNTITFTVVSGVRGRRELQADVYLWDEDTRVVVSDIDGTITKSDVLGLLLPAMGKDWSHPGIASLYNNIVNNGYKMVYLSSRSISQAQATKNYIKSVRQGNAPLPEGPIVVSPDRIVASLAREVIYHNPDAFKIAALQELRALFPTEINPFYAGFGNKVTDERSYSAVGFPTSRIFIISKGGVLKNSRTLQTYTNYSEIDTLVNEVFPNRYGNTQISEDYNTFAYWKSGSDFVEIDL